MANAAAVAATRRAVANAASAEADAAAAPVVAWRSAAAIWTTVHRSIRSGRRRTPTATRARSLPRTTTAQAAVNDVHDVHVCRAVVAPVAREALLDRGGVDGGWQRLVAVARGRGRGPWPWPSPKTWAVAVRRGRSPQDSN